MDKLEPRDKLSANLRQELLNRIFPRLAELPPVHREDALKKARATPFDLMESIGIGGAAALVAGFLQAVPLDPDGNFLEAYLDQFCFTLPLLLVTAGPFFLRRARRGLDSQIECYRKKREPGKTTP
ncbi:MAG: hypothetical protein V5B33_09105 [Candidatus Accumulibacter sp. UW20]